MLVSSFLPWNTESPGVASALRGEGKRENAIWALVLHSFKEYMDMDNDEMCGTAHDEVSVCGAHGRFTRVGTRDGGDGSGGWCECVCDEGWSTLQGGDVLLSQMPTLSNPDSSAWCSVNVEESGSAAPTIPPVRQTGTSDSSSSAIAFLDVRTHTRALSHADFLVSIITRVRMADVREWFRKVGRHSTHHTERTMCTNSS